MLDERTLFDRFHEALDVEPRPGAYERLRNELTRPPVALRRRPVFPMRFSKMGLRMAAGLVAALIAIALIATFIAVHNRPVGEVPGHPDASVVTFRAMTVADYNVMNGSTSNHCDNISDTGCAAAIQPVNDALQKWVTDLQNFPNTPPQYAALATILRAHLKAVIDDQVAAIAFQKAGDATRFDLAMKHTFFQRAWIDPVSFAIEGRYAKVATSFTAAATTARTFVDSCLGNSPTPDVWGCNHLVNYEPCDGALAFGCVGDLESVETPIETFLIGIAQNPAPAASASRSARLQQDLVNADANALAIQEALLTGDAGRVNLAESKFSQAIEAVSSDLSTIL